MPSRPFPYPVSIGIDICKIRRIYDLISKDNGKWRRPFLRKIFNSQERRTLPSVLGEKQLSTAGVHSHNTWRLAQFLAGRWAAKEAAIKAIRSRRATFHEITIESREGRPHMLIDLPRAHSTETTAGKAAPSDRNGGEVEDGAGETHEARLSISHDDAYATAVVMAIDESPEV
ncbi:hypothetical protein GP486_003944 [Trichoglossum hirsutum]|uniref:4'-phosphopantetheinyl transferase domain-containing protein n=1 Tax=Trichoglossum hirsutum TaxID=265104 RepID=A0A9P8LC36_9PEZI|nr:hypothetical protein GP486_003944 [Trichoglossum hirsutum]